MRRSILDRCATTSTKRCCPGGRHYAVRPERPERPELGRFRPPKRNRHSEYSQVGQRRTARHIPITQHHVSGLSSCVSSAQSHKTVGGWCIFQGINMAMTASHSTSNKGGETPSQKQGPLPPTLENWLLPRTLMFCVFIPGSGFR